LNTSGIAVTSKSPDGIDLPFGGLRASVAHTTTAVTRMHH
jgi:hypothetical protein